MINKIFEWYIKLNGKIFYWVTIKRNKILWYFELLGIMLQLVIDFIAKYFLILVFFIFIKYNVSLISKFILLIVIIDLLLKSWSFMKDRLLHIKKVILR